MQHEFKCCRKHDIVASDQLHFCLSCGELETSTTNNGATKPLRDPRTNDLILRSSLPHKYLPVADGEFRLIEVQPGEYDDELVCWITHEKVDQASYAAISYTWADESGNQALERDIIICSDALLGSRITKVTVNCDLALRRVRDTIKSRMLWIDTLCIDQANAVERGHQVQQMQRIYANAATVYAYIGEAADRSDDLLDALNEYKLGGALRQIPVAVQPQRARSWLDAFLRRRWFTRVWCLQEVGMAQRVEVMCGDKTILWSQLVMADLQRFRVDPSARTNSAYTDPYEYYGAFPLILQLPMKGKQPPNKLYSLLEAARTSCDATDQRDRVYALLGLLELADDEKIAPDYELTVAEVYNRTTAHIITHYKTLDFLSQAELRGHVPQPKSTSLASWAIDWTSRSPCQSRLDLVGSSLQGFDTDSIYCNDDMDLAPYSIASRHYWPHVFDTKFKAPNILTTSGRVVGKVMMVFPTVAQSGGEFLALLTKSWPAPRFLPNLVLRHKMLNAVRPPDMKDIWQERNTIYKIMKYWWPNVERRDFPVVYDHHFLWYALSKDPSSTPEVSGDRSFDPWEWKSIERSIMAAFLSMPMNFLRSKRAEGRTTFITKDWSIGVGPSCLREGDLICKFTDATMTHCIRTKGTHHVLLGEAFLLCSDRLRDNLNKIFSVRLTLYDCIKKDDRFRHLDVSGLIKSTLRFYNMVYAGVWTSSGVKQSFELR
jgi:hypothetical protein